MEKGNSYVYFALKGDSFDPKEITRRIGIEPSDSKREGDVGEYNSSVKYSYWKVSTEKGKEYFEIDKLVNEVISALYDKIEIINEVKNQFQLESVLEIVLDIDINPEISTPAIGHDLKTIEFLFKTNTVTDIDIYRFNSREKE